MERDPGEGASQAEGIEILVIDDEPVVIEGIRKVLEARGHRVAEARDAASALVHPALATCRLVICDLMLPDRSGLSLLAAVRQRRPDLPAILITGYATSEQAERARAAGRCLFLAKPFEEAELLDAVERAAASREASAKESPS